MNNKKIYVGNLSFNTTKDGLTEKFSEFGELVDVKVIENYETGQSKGFGFITFESEDGAQAALEMNGQELDGRPLRVNIAEDKPKRR
jgi:cold-inducible RNA-binding protein